MGLPVINIDIDANTLQQITAIATVIIALTAVFISIWQILSTRKHNRLSVTPLMRYYIVYNKSEMEQGIYLSNTGIGPAIIISYKVTVDGKETPKNRYLDWSLHTNKLDIDNSFVRFRKSNIGVTISKGETLPLLTACENIDKKQENKFLAALLRISIEIEYESIYRDQKWIMVFPNLNN